ncbi:MAG TPA: hypothetical protein VHW90_12820 [Stellaceae bacterium]|jgi:hypothetical protein|nr:hypothetical protein [Stellaceae bacterium]
MLYLRVSVGQGCYLLSVAGIFEIRPDPQGGEEGFAWQGQAAPPVDLPALLDDKSGTPGFCVLYAQEAGEPASLIVDGVDGLVELDDDELSPLPPIGPVGTLLDAISTSAGARPLLRLRGEHALATAASLAAALG